MKCKAFFVIVILLCSGMALAKPNPWGELKKIHFYDSTGDMEQVLVHLEKLDFKAVKRTEQKEIAQRLIRFGDNYLSHKKFQYADAFYRKVMTLSPDYWYLYNKLDKIEREKGAMFVGLSNLFGQWVMMLKSFRASFLMLNHTFNVLFFAGMFVFFIFGAIIFVKYFRLAGNDIVIDKDGHFSMIKMLFIAVATLWPVFVLGGWMIYPFLFCGFLWFYINENEKKAVKYMLIVVAGFSLIYCMNLMLEKNYTDPQFKKVEKIYAGHLFNKKDYSSFDDPLKVVQAYSYYENKKLNTALDILNSTGENYENALKYILLGNIYYRFGDSTRSNEFFQKALRVDENNPVALNNFALVLLKDNNPGAFAGFARRYPQLKTLRTKELEIKVIEPSQGALWPRLFSESQSSFSPWIFIKSLVSQLFKLPVFYYILLFVLYVTLIKKISPHLGESTFCSKCAKIIKEASVHRSYKLCDECYQLFSIKDVIFLEAKILKEKELKKKFKYQYVFFMALSILIPGLNLNQRENNRLFLVFSTIFYFLLAFTLVGVINFDRGYSASPLFFNLIGAVAIVVYFFVNLFSVLGDEDGF